MEAKKLSPIIKVFLAFLMIWMTLFLVWLGFYSFEGYVVKFNKITNQVSLFNGSDKTWIIINQSDTKVENYKGK